MKGDLEQVARAPAVEPPSRTSQAEAIRRGFVRAYVDAQQTPPVVAKNLDGKPWHALVDFGLDESARSGVTLEDVGHRLGRGALARRRFSFAWLVDNPREFFDSAPANTLGGGETPSDLLHDLTEAS